MKAASLIVPIGLLVASSLSAAKTLAAPYPIVAHLYRGTSDLQAADDVSVRPLHGKARRGIAVGDALNDVRIAIPAGETVVVASPDGRDAITLDPRTTAFFDYSAGHENVTVTAGRFAEDDTYGFFSHLTTMGGIALAPAGDPTFTVDVEPTSVTISSQSGALEAKILAAPPVAGACGRIGAAYATRVDEIASGGRSARVVYRYTAQGQTRAIVSLADDEAAAQHGSAYGEYDLGSRYQEGQHGVARSYASALYWYRRAASQGFAAAQSRLGVMYEEGLGVTTSFSDAQHWLRLAADEGFPEAERDLGELYAAGHGVTQSNATAMRWYRLAAAQGSAAAESDIGDAYRDGLGVQRSYALAAHWYELASAQSFPGAERMLGILYDHGWGVQKSYAEALHLFHRAADQGFAAAYNNIGFMYNFAHGVPRDYAAALQWYTRAADDNVTCAYVNIGVLYQQGQGVVRSYETAAHWYDLAAARGNDEGEDRLGLLYVRGDGVGRSYAAALHLFRLSAAQGFASGEAHLGMMYEYGYGVRRDVTTALHWYRLAAAQENPDAVAAIRRLERHATEQ